MQIEQEKIINYLDQSPTKTIKESHTEYIIPFDSSSRYSTELSAFNSMASLLVNVPIDPEEYSTERNTILTVTTSNDFPTNSYRNYYYYFFNLIDFHNYKKYNCNK